MSSAALQSAAVLQPPPYAARVLFLGANGSGKSALAAQMLASGYRWVVIDSKGDFPAVRPFHVVRSPDGWAWRWPHEHLLYRPAPEYNRGAWLDETLRRLFVRAQKEGRKKPFVVYVDEALYLARTGHVQWLSALAVSGRSLGVGLWTASQRPKWIPVEVRSEAWRTYVFYLQHAADEREVVADSKGLLTEEDMQAAAVDYSFYELKRGNAGRLEVRHFPPVRIQGGK
jgi:hypothetical protein